MVRLGQGPNFVVIAALAPFASPVPQFRKRVKFLGTRRIRVARDALMYSICMSSYVMRAMALEPRVIFIAYKISLKHTSIRS
jgi:hypothetical protein